MKYLLDTNTCVDLMKNQPEVVKKISALQPADCVVSAITVYELCTGIAKCRFPSKEQAKVDLLFQSIKPLSFEFATAQEAGKLRAGLESRGEMIGPYDILIAAQAALLKLTVVTANTKEFSRIPGLQLENWRQAI